MIGPEDVKAVVDAFMQTDLMQWVSRKMKAETEAEKRENDRRRAIDAAEGGQFAQARAANANHRPSAAAIAVDGSEQSRYSLAKAFGPAVHANVLPKPVSARSAAPKAAAAKTAAPKPPEIPPYVLTDVPPRLLADEAKRLVMRSREAATKGRNPSGEVGFDEALRLVENTRLRGASPHRYHEFENVELYRMDAINERITHLERQSTQQSSSEYGQQTAMRVMAHVQMQRSLGRNINYEQGRAELGVA